MPRAWGSWSSASDQRDAPIVETFRNFGVAVQVVDVIEGLRALHVRFKTTKPVRMSTLKEFAPDLCYALGVPQIEIDAPLLGTSLIEVRIPKADVPLIAWQDGMHALGGIGHALAVPLGLDEFNTMHVVDLASTWPVLIAGTAGCGKSMLVHSIINALLLRNPPDIVRFVLCDGGHVELAQYNPIPHLLTPVITDPKKVVLVLKWLDKEVERRFRIFEDRHVRNIEDYHHNVLAPAMTQAAQTDSSAELPEAMPYIVVVIDEIAPFTAAFPREIEAAMGKLLLMSRAVGIQMLVTTADTTGKRLPGSLAGMFLTRVAMTMPSSAASRKFIDVADAARLRGAGDMLYRETTQLVRVQGTYISDDEVHNNINDVVRRFATPSDELTSSFKTRADEHPYTTVLADGSEADELYSEAKAVVLEAGKASTSYLQRKLGVGYARAAHLMDLLEDTGVIGPADGSKPRDVIATNDE